MFRKKGAKDSTLKSSGKVTKDQNSHLVTLISKMQNDADTVEKHILRSEELMAVDAENEKNEKPFLHQTEISDRLGEAEGLLKVLFLDVDTIRKLKHPQAKEIENDVSHLHERWLKDCAFYRDIYEQIDDVSLMPIIDWGPVFNKKQHQVASEEFGPSMADLEKQIAAHNILHKEVEGYKSQLCLSSAGSKEKYTELKKQYNKMLDNSKWRHHYLTSLYEYMHGCNKELNFLGEEQNKIKKQDWSDRMVDPPDVRRQYENFKNNSLLSHESDVNKLQDEGDRLIELKHPASATIQAQRDAVRGEWQKFLNLCICQETHLDNVEEYKKYQMDAEQLSENLTKLNNSLDPKSLSKQSNSETLLQLNLEEKSVQDAEKQLADLRKRSTSIVPLKLRRNASNRPITVESLCDWDTSRDSLSRGEKLTLKSNSDTEKWNVVAADGATKTFPGVCFQIPAPDPDSIDQVDLLGKELADIKKRRATLEASLKNHKSEASQALQSAPASSAPMDPKATALAQELNNVDKGLTNAEDDLLSLLRAPLSRSDPSGDLAKRLQDQEKAAKALQDLERQRLGTQAGLKSLPSGASSSLPLQLNSANNKADKLAALSDLYKKKANASLNLESQINKVDGIVSGFEKKLSEDGPILDGPNTLQAATDDIRNQSRSVAAAQGDMKKLSQDLETTEQLCSSLQQGYQEYCPDIQRQRTDVKTLQNRYENVSNQLKERELILQEAAAKNQDFQSTSRSLNNFLDNMPKSQINPSDGPSQIAAKQSAQERAMEELKRKGDDMDRVADLSQDLQGLLNQYDSNIEKFNCTIEDNGVTAPKRAYTPTLAEAVQKQEKDLVNHYAETTAESAQRQKQMSLAKNLIDQNEEKVHMVEQQQVQQHQNAQRSSLELNSLLKELDEEKERMSHTENDLRTFRERMMSLKNRRGVERIEEKEVLQYYRDPKLESDLSEFQSKLHEESLKRSTIQSEVEVYKNKIISLEDTIKNAPPKLATREVTEFEKDPQLDIEAAKLKDEIARVRDEIRVRDSEHIQMKTEVSILQQKRPTIKERIVKKEVVKVEQDPEMLKAVRSFELEISDEGNKSKLINDQIFQTRSEINALERLIPYIQPKVITKEVKSVEQDPELINESKSLKTNLETEKVENDSLSREVIELQSRYRQVQDIRPKVEVKEIVNEIYRIDPNTEMEIVRLRKDIQESNSQRLNLDRDLTTITSDLNVIRAQKPKVEVKEVLQEVVKEERSPENEREIQRLNDQLYRLNSSYNSLNEQVRVLRNDRDQWKAEKSKIETKVITKEVVKYEPDPLLEKEAERLRRNVREEAQLRRSHEEMLFDLKNKYILLERQKPEEKVVVQEVVRLQKDPRQIADHERLSRSLDEEVKTRRQFELELQQLRTKVEDKQRVIKENEEHQRLIQAQSELREIRMRITQLENAPPPVEESIVVEEVLKVERDPKLERKTIGLRSEMDKETNDILRIQREIRNITAKLEILQREKSNERTVYKEIVRVEKDQAVESARDRLREEVSQQRFSRQDVEDEIRRIKDRTNQLVNSKSSTSREETSLVSNRDALLREKDNLTRELRTLETKRQDINISFQQQSRLISERSQMSRQRSMKMESDVQRLEREILEEKDRIHQRDSTIRDLILNLQKEEQAETRTKETNVSTKITILDPETGRDMSPYDAYLQGLIDRQQYIHLQELECDWEEITTMGPDGETSVLQDRKSGKQYSIKDALKTGRVKESDYQTYKSGKMPISEFALLVAGEKNKAPEFNSIKPKTSSTVKSAPSVNSTGSQIQPVAGVIDTNTDTCYPIRSATMRKLIDPTTAQRLLEAQAATGGIIDISTRERYPVNKAATRGLIEDSQLQRLHNAQKAFSGVEDPVTRECLSVGEAVQKGWMPKETGTRYMEAQHLTGGLVNPKTGARVGIMDALASKMIDSTMVRELQSERSYTKDIVDPLTKEKINYKQALDRCKRDPMSGLPMLPASSKDSGYNSTYTSRYARF
ncbi:envoplakin-like [Synchiropus splendidus]|uniref:envoplakin-like n=1 Tax=Synchiropus splendidus TaxID=270530 RepID=UPI00237E80C7|nr:envoplakin-like [Synchiropus splendidus]